MVKLQQIIFDKENCDNSYICYEDQMAPKVNFENDELKEFYENHRNDIIEEVVEQMEEYLQDEDLCNDDEGMFPQPKYMTGEWYIGTINMEDDYLSICARFVGTDTGEKTDYLGLEVSFYFDIEEGSWEFDGINSEAL